MSELSLRESRSRSLRRVPEHLPEKARYPVGSPMGKQELLEQRDRLIAAHPRTRFQCAHVADSPEDLAYVGRFLEIRDPYFEYPDYVGRWGHSRWRIYGLGLSDRVLKKVYYRNALRYIPGLEVRP